MVTALASQSTLQLIHYRAQVFPTVKDLRSSSSFFISASLMSQSGSEARVCSHAWTPKAIKAEKQLSYLSLKLL